MLRLRLPLCAHQGSFLQSGIRPLSAFIAARDGEPDARDDTAAWASGKSPSSSPLKAAAALGALGDRPNSRFGDVIRTYDFGTKGCTVFDRGVPRRKRSP
ncbi:hypothetical protein MINT15_13040 [Saccharomonospora viridis]|uniref:Uncharacterized protein n=1 Tax=Saccharomonospora viridis TaxID=1852 RepID=A0A837DAK0_9PSEU|nr:hypothetical protein MINT15_13040 [Saccharomonospora viridis]